ncbi:metalloprotease TldD [Xylella fastidiosa]|uniref:Metalloprotease TldD n=1 Tax=Xylella fastidiosa subsp. multiplex TaxID=644357 RepID=A0A9Q4MJ12_XYLFS|nr:metalloprotease TldD [Xylella fastidiosa]ERI60884.1 protease TldD [Xylella fastidiosa subsp. multiplex Griffin-1]ACA11482.1 TldD protein [Xylella fastidiosa M12]KAJ4852364.1 metalloprotease TldD [Xylella fastidiosa subsp. multiplex]KFA41915.1 TldD protein [Xylella fastidiosa]MBE0268409.1 metalloprotease TldD [Xylella fastidiosa subsp. multiplex]
MKNTALSVAESRLLLPAGLDDGQIDSIFGTLLGPGVDFGDLYFQHARRESWSIEDGIVKDGTHSIEQGVGVRAISGEKTGFAYSDDINRDALLEAAYAARAISRSPGDGVQGTHAVLRRHGRELCLYPALDPVGGMDNAEKIAVMRRVDQLLRAADPRVTQVMINLSGGVDVVLIARSDGVLAADVRPLVRLNVQVIVEGHGRRESGYAGGGGRYGYAELFADGRPEAFAREALRQALVNLEAIPAPAGVMPVVLGAGWPGVLLHEAVGHGLEGDFNRKATSVYAGRIGERVASPGVTIVDDGTLDGRRGSLNIDDEGTPTQCTTLIEDGVLVGYMQDTLNARLMGVASTGNGRRESFAHLTMPRMTNTYMRAGAHSREEMIRSVKKGLYAVNFGGGQVDITSGKYVFSATEAYLIEDGRVTAPIKGATLIGNGPETMQRVRMIGDDLALDAGVGVCGKDGQSVPVGVGQPSLLIDGLTVGGTQA